MAAEYYCSLTPRGSKDLIAPDLHLEVDEATGAVTVLDGVIEREIGKPIAGALRSANDVRLLVGWTIPRRTNTTGQFTHGFHYTLNIRRANGDARIAGKVQGYNNDWRGKGTCERREMTRRP